MVTGPELSHDQKSQSHVRIAKAAAPRASRNTTEPMSIAATACPLMGFSSVLECNGLRVIPLHSEQDNFHRRARLRNVSKHGLKRLNGSK